MKTPTEFRSLSPKVWVLNRALRPLLENQYLWFWMALYGLWLYT